MLYLDTETCGFRGVLVTIQYAEDDGETEIWNAWTNPCGQTLELIEYICQQEVCAFNLAFDWFHLSKIYSLFKCWCSKAKGNILRYPDDHIDELKDLEREAVGYANCLKPRASLDLMLVAKQGEFQDLMNRKPVIVRRVPEEKIHEVCDYLNEQLWASDHYNPAFFHKSKHKGWKVVGTNLMLVFAPSMTLKVLMAKYLKRELASFHDIMPKVMPKEHKYDPCGTEWHKCLDLHVRHYEYNELARKYAADDVEYLRQLRGFLGNPVAGDDDSELAAMVGTVRWSGFRVNTEEIANRRLAALKISNATPKSPRRVREYLHEVCTPIEQTLVTGTDKYKLTEYASWMNNDPCPDCQGLGVPIGSVAKCQACKGTGSLESGVPHPIVERAKLVMEARSAAKEVELYDKLLKTGRFHTGFSVIGAKSSRMSGSDGLNPQGIKRDLAVRACFPLADSHEHLEGGDFDSFEVALMEAEWKDPKLRETLLAGKKLHGLVGAVMSGLTYEEVMKKESDPSLVQGTWYANGKTAVFAMGYGGNEYTLKRKLGLTEARAKECFKAFTSEYEGIAKARQEIQDLFTAIDVRDFSWQEPADYCETFLGFKRYFTLENTVIKMLYDTAMNMPEHLKDDVTYVVRNTQKGAQSVTQAIKSALLGGAIGLQNANQRAAGNHRTQSPGGAITKELERNIWDLQPHGVNEFLVKPLNIHDEVMVCTKLVGAIAPIVERLLEKYRPHVPLIAMDWSEDLTTWADK